MGVPFDIGTTYRAGTRFGPQAVRRISALYTTYNYEMALDLRESLDVVDIGDVWTIANIEKSFDQISKAVSFVAGKGVFRL
jgi:agmatinase